MIRQWWGVGLVAGLVVLAGCGTPPQLGDRGGVEGAGVDLVGDVDFVITYRNADGLPNITRVCVDGVAFASSSSPRASGEGGTNGGAPIIRVAEWDDKCAAGPRAPAPAPPAPVEAPRTAG